MTGYHAMIGQPAEGASNLKHAVANLLDRRPTVKGGELTMYVETHLWSNHSMSEDLYDEPNVVEQIAEEHEWREYPPL
jgi:hypothetical protein